MLSVSELFSKTATAETSLVVGVVLFSCLNPYAQARGARPAERLPASPNVTVSITQEQAKSFRETFNALAEKTHTTFVAEGQPMAVSLAPEAHPVMKKGGEALSALVPKMAQCYGYDSDRSGTAYILQKQYEDPEDIPEITLAECAQSIKDVTSAVDAFSPHLHRGDIADDPAIGSLIHSFTPKQIQALADKEHGLPVAALSPDQQGAVQQLVLFFYVQMPTDDFQTRLTPLSRALNGDPKFCQRDLSNLPVSGKMRFASLPLFGYELPNVTSGRTNFTILSRPGQIDMQGGGVALKFLTIEDGVYHIPPTPDPTDPPAATAAAKPSKLPEAASLGQLVERLNARPEKHPEMLVDAALAAKRICVFGEQFTPPDRLLYAVADLYGLRVVTDEKGRLCLTRPAVQTPSDFTGLYQAVQWALPAPLLHAQQRHGFRRPSPLHVAAVRHLRTVIEPKLLKAKDGRVALSSLSSREGAALATALLADAIGTLGDVLLRPVPPAVTQFNGLYLTGDVTVKDGHRTISLFLNTLNADGTGLVTGPGVGNMKYDP